MHTCLLRCSCRVIHRIIHSHLFPLIQFQCSSQACRRAHSSYASVHANVDKFVSHQLLLIEEEHEAERQQILDENGEICLSKLIRRGSCISQLSISSLKKGLYGRHIATFARSVESNIPSNVFSSGDIVMVYRGLDIDFSFTGVVTHVSNEKISVVFDGGDKRRLLKKMDGVEEVSLVKAVNDITYSRLKTAIEDLRSHKNGHSFPLINILFGNAVPSSFNIKNVDFSEPSLNECQRKAIISALNQRELSVIHGPPGTGKTTTVVEIIAQMVEYGQKVLACAPSNVAVDNLVENLLQFRVSGSQGGSRKIKMVRLGHPARMPKQEVRNLCLDALLDERDVTLGDFRNFMADFKDRLARCKNNRQRQELKQKRKKMLRRYASELKILTDLLSSADVILATNASAHPESWLSYLKPGHFDVTVIDECGQALEASCWIPMLRSRKCILAGDHLQLPPVVLSSTASRKGLSYTLLQRTVDRLGDQVVFLLTEQYRMHRDIMRWASSRMYGGKLRAHSTVAEHLLKDLTGVKETEETSSAMTLIDTAGHGMFEMTRNESESIGNEGEVRLVCHQVARLCEAGVNYRDIAIITPYNLQVRLLSDRLHAKYPLLEIKSVDGFQGREKEAVILSLVRSNKVGSVGFLADQRRLNVAVTRARRHLTLVCDSSTVSKHRFIRSLVSHIKECGKVRTPDHYQDDTSIAPRQLQAAQVT